MQQDSGGAPARVDWAFCEAHLAPYAVSSQSSRGRRRPEPAHSIRTPFQRDRDRVIHSRSFRRLEYKTQVFLNGTGDHLRTRLTHTIEVTAIARTIARPLRTNEDLTEAIALAHDLGHTPFGHVGERVLDELLQHTSGGFDHNQQSLRVVDSLEKKYPDTDGLNLSWEVRSGLVKHRTSAPSVLDGQQLRPRPTLEAQIADVADDLAYYAHDIDDGLDAGLITPGELEGVALWHMSAAEAERNGGDREADYFTAFVVRCLIDMLVNDVVENTRECIRRLVPTSPEDVQNAREPAVGFSEALAPHSSELRAFLFEHVYWHPTVLAVNQRMGNIIRDLFHVFTRRPDKLGQSAQGRLPCVGLERAVADYIAGMTDRYALALHEELCGPPAP